MQQLGESSIIIYISRNWIRQLLHMNSITCGNRDRALASQLNVDPSTTTQKIFILRLWQVMRPGCVTTTRRPRPKGRAGGTRFNVHHGLRPPPGRLGRWWAHFSGIRSESSTWNTHHQTGQYPDIYILKPSGDCNGPSWGNGEGKSDESKIPSIILFGSRWILSS